MSYRPWLRDEFCFCCVYCLVREQWGRIQGMFDIDHFVPLAVDPAGQLRYDNLLYACATCNAAKGKQRIPDPCQALVADDVRVEEDGKLVADTPQARRIIRVLGLNDPEQVEFRLLWLNIIALAQRFDPELHERLLGFPEDLPDLQRLRPRGGNLRPGGIGESYFARCATSMLPQTY
jgi:hypothetical protein